MQKPTKMLIAPRYQQIYDNQAILTDEEYFVRYIWFIEHLYINELALLKNHRSEFVAFTRKMSEEFDLGPEILGKTFSIVSSVPIHVRREIERQESLLLREQKPQTSFYFYKKGSQIRNYLVKKRPVTNPATGNSVGILINTELVMPNLHRKFIMKEFLGLSKNVMNISKPDLPPIQRQIIFCLLLGIHSRKEIADTLCTITGNFITENQVKNSLQALYNEFGCNNSSQLVSLALNDQIPFELPDSTIPLGNYLI